ncbi:MAG: HAD family hydrolase [Proteobacteria bacterium]|nr:HAD family hydrolase [Pseudomonadota bacterium]
MPRLSHLKIKESLIDASCVVFDKDGTLIDFHKIWGPRLMRGADRLVQELSLSNEFYGHLYRALGFDDKTGVTDGQGPLATAPLSQFATIVANVVFQYGISWDSACDFTDQLMVSEMTAGPRPEELIPRGDIKKSLSRLYDAGFTLTVATTDNRAATQSALDTLRIGHLFSDIRCGDDVGPVKPDVAVLENIAIGQRCRVDQIVMVGDTVSDLMMAKNAGAKCCVGILGGAGSTDQLQAFADFLIEDIREIQPDF